MIDFSGWRKRQIALDQKADNAKELGLNYKPEHEPVAWEQFHENMAGPNYVAPQREWVGLTDEEFQYCVELKNPEAIIEEVEAKLKEKNT